MAEYLTGGKRLGEVFVQGDSGQYYKGLRGGIFNTALDDTESERETLVDAAYTGELLRCSVTANTNGDAATFRLRINQTGTSPFITIPANTTGEFSDSNTASISSGDDVSFEIELVGLGHSEAMTLRWWTFKYSGTGDSTWIGFGADSPSAYDHDAVCHATPHGGGTPSITLPVSSNFQTVVATTIDKVRVLVTQNNSAARTLTSLVEDVTGNISVSIGANTTGLISDISNNDVLSANDNYRYSISTGISSGGDTTEIHTISCNSSADAYTAIASGDLSVFANNQTIYTEMMGTSTNVTESNIALVAEIAETVDRATVSVKDNNVVTGSQVVTLRINSTDGNQSMSIGAGLTGQFRDTSNSDVITATDNINWRIVETDSGNAFVGLTYISVDLPQQAAPPVGTRRIFIT